MRFDDAGDCSQLGYKSARHSRLGNGSGKMCVGFMRLSPRNNTDTTLQQEVHVHIYSLNSSSQTRAPRASLVQESNRLAGAGLVLASAVATGTGALAGALAAIDGITEVLIPRINESNVRWRSEPC